MATKKEPLPTFNVTFDLKVTLGVPVTAQTFELALEQARTFKPFDIIEVSNEHTDIYDYDAAKITGIHIA